MRLTNEHRLIEEVQVRADLYHTLWKVTEHESHQSARPVRHTGRPDQQPTREAPTNSLKPESKACEQAIRSLLRALAKRGTRRRAVSAARQPAVRALRVGSSSTKMAASTSPAKELAAEKMLSS